MLPQGLSVAGVLADRLPRGQPDADMGERVCKAMGDMGVAVQPEQLCVLSPGRGLVRAAV